MNKYERMVQDKKLEKDILRVGAYCRVSTDKDDQVNSFESQQKYFKEYIERNPKWQLAEIFADEGKSGTSTKKRAAFNRMIACAKSGELDLIITKEISRFARNTLDSIYYTRELKRLGVGVVFLNDNINTLEPDAELRLTIMSSIAQEESRKTSDRVKWGQKRRMEQGVVFGRDMLGYDVRGGEMFINEEGAEIVRLIFHKFVNELKGTHVIARELREDGIKSYKHNKEWSNTAILRVIRNEKYCGDLVQKKTFTPDYLSHEKKYNRGEEEFVILKDHHEPIISREMFEKANEILESRAVSQEGKAKHSNRYAFSGKIKCACCDSTYVARYKTRKDGSKYKAWRCFQGTQHGSPHIDKAGNHVGCSNESIRNEDAAYIMGLVVRSFDFEKDIMISNLLGAIQDVLSADNAHIQTETLENRLIDLETQQARLIEIYMSGTITRDEFMAARSKCDTETQQVKDLIVSAEKQNMLVNCQQTLMKDIENALREMVDGVCLDDAFYRNILERMVIHNRDRVDVYLTLMPHKWSYAIEKASRSISPTDIGTAFNVELCDKMSECSSGGSISPTDIGTEEMAHSEMVSAMVHQLTRKMSMEDIKRSGFDTYFVDHTAGIYPVSAAGIPFDAKYFASKGDAITDLTEDMAAEQKARTTYDNILRLVDDPDVREPIKFLREREIVHFQRFGEALGVVTDNLNSKNFYGYNPEFDKKIK